jgi:hypothetical protein
MDNVQSCVVLWDFIVMRSYVGIMLGSSREICSHSNVHMESRGVIIDCLECR